MNPFLAFTRGDDRINLADIAARLEEADARAFARQLSDEQFEEFHAATLAFTSRFRLQVKLQLGSYLWLHHTAADELDRRKAFNQLVARLNYKESTGYDLIRVFKTFGTVFAEHPEWSKDTSYEALRALCRDKVTDEIRREALELISQGKYVSYKRAQALVAQMLGIALDADEAKQEDAPTQDGDAIDEVLPTPTSADKTSDALPEADEVEADLDAMPVVVGRIPEYTEPIMEYRGEKTIITIQIVGDAESADVLLIHRDMELCLAQFETDFIRDQKQA